MGKLHLLADDTALKVLSWKSPVNKEDRSVTLGGNGITAWAKRELVCYFAGELIDVDAYTGGFNLQIAFSTATVAGTSAAWG